jgi:UDP-N-acetylglucosamine 1-carboxyvinyltransferase
LAKGAPPIYNAACEPHVQDLGALLNKMGAHITGLGTNLIRIEGVDRLHGADHTIGPDYIEVGSYLCAAAVTGGDADRHRLPGDFADLRGHAAHLQQAGRGLEIRGRAAAPAGPQISSA